MSYVSRRSWKSSSSGLGYSKKGSNKTKKIILFILLLFIFYEAVTSFFLISYRLESISMEPTIPAGGIVFATPLSYGPELKFTNIRIPGWRKPVRGDLVISQPSYRQELSWYMEIADAVIGFFTLQKKGIEQDENWTGSLNLKRVIGVPGDSVMMKDFELLIKPAGKNYFFSEKEIMQVEYSIIRGIIPKNITDDFPLSGNMKEITLGEDEYFLAGDNRAMSNDSYYWGPVKLDDIKAKVLIEYSPEIKVLQ